MKFLLLVIIEIFMGHEGTVFGDTTTCYTGLGCFDNGYPWSWLLRPVPAPASPKEVNTTFYLFYGREGHHIVLTTWPEISFEGTPFNSSRNTIFITHGFQDGVLGSWPEEMAQTIASKDSVNVIAVDWSGGADMPFFLYPAAVSNTRIAGAEISRVILYIMSAFNVSRTSFHLIGHSLGAHVCAYASNGAGGIFWITGLDCAQPLFEGYDARVYLDKSDACIVDAVHTDARPLIPFLGVGFIEPVGDIDYYVNGGVHQPGCTYPDLIQDDNTTLLSFILSGDIVTALTSCRHQRAHEYYYETIKNDACIMWSHQDFISKSYILRLTIGQFDPFPDTPTECSLDSCIPIGLNTTKYPARGAFLTKTGDEEPFCLPEPVIDRSMAADMSTYRDTYNRSALCEAKNIQVD